MNKIAPATLAAALIAAAASPAAAQSVPFIPEVYVGIEAGTGERSADDFDTPGDYIATDEGNGFDYGAFVGVELPVFPLGYMAVEAGIGDSRGKTSVVVDDGTTVSEVEARANFNWSGTARLGLAPLRGLAAYGIAGYGGEQVDVTVTDQATGAIQEFDDSMDGVIYGLGARYEFGENAGARLEYRHREASGHYDPEQIMVGAFVNF